MSELRPHRHAPQKLQRPTNMQRRHRPKHNLPKRHFRRIPKDRNLQRTRQIPLQHQNQELIIKTPSPADDPALIHVSHVEPNDKDGDRAVGFRN